MRLELERAAAVGNDVEFMLVGRDRNPIDRHFEEVDGRLRVERKHRGPDGGSEPIVDRAKRQDDLDMTRLQLLEDRVQSIEAESHEFLRENEVFAQ